MAAVTTTAVLNIAFHAFSAWSSPVNAMRKVKFPAWKLTALLYIVVSAVLQCKQVHFMQLTWNTEFSRNVQTYSKPHAYSLEH